jgi:RNA polymerase sigma-70 factor, ECF subfamily
VRRLQLGAGVQDFQRFYEENLGLVYRFVYSKVRNKEEAEELTSHVFLKAVRRLDLERSAQSGQAWLFQVARTTIADYWRDYFRGSASSLDELQEAGWEGPVEDDPAIVNDRAEELVQSILKNLPKRYREVLTCRFLLNLSVRETAVKMGLTESNVKVMQFRALKRAADLEQVVAVAVECGVEG